MRIAWHGQSAFLVEGSRSVFVDPFDAARESFAARGLQFDYPPIEGVTADVLLVTHEHRDHNGVEAIGGRPIVVRSTAGRFDSPVGAVVAVAAEHDDAAGTARGSNILFGFELDGVRFCHLGDLGQQALRPEQRDALGAVDVLFVPVGDGPTIGGDRAAEVVRALDPRLVIPMHYRTGLVNFLDPPDAFLDALGARVERIDSSEVEVERVLGTREDPTVVLLAPPRS